MLSYSGLIAKQKEINACIGSIKNHIFTVLNRGVEDDHDYAVVVVLDDVYIYRLLIFLDGRKELFSLKKKVTSDNQLTELLNIHDRADMISYLESLTSSQRCKPFKLEV